MPEVENYLGDSAMRDELAQRLATSQGIAAMGNTPTFKNDANTAIAVGDVSRLGGLLGITNRRLDESPITEQAAETDTMEDLQLKSRMAGFGSPQEQAAYGRQQERNKLEMPLRQTNAQGDWNVRQANVMSEGDIAQQRVASEGQENVARMYTGEQAASRASMERVAQDRNSQLTGYRPPTRTGGGGVSFASPVNLNPTMTDLAQAHRDLDGVRAQQGWLENSAAVVAKTAEVRGMQQALITQFITNGKLSQDDAARIIDVLDDTALANLTSDQILQQLAPNLSPEDADSVYLLLSQLRGK
jgi:hypothetical protein